MYLTERTHTQGLIVCALGLNSGFALGLVLCEIGQAHSAAVRSAAGFSLSLFQKKGKASQKKKCIYVSTELVYFNVYNRTGNFASQ